jgi:hypothetical protein
LGTFFIASTASTVEVLILEPCHAVVSHLRIGTQAGVLGGFHRQATGISPVEDAGFGLEANRIRPLRIRPAA